VPDADAVDDGLCSRVELEVAVEGRISKAADAQRAEITLGGEQTEILAAWPASSRMSR
jgi:hypothetical protein